MSSESPIHPVRIRFGIMASSMKFQRWQADAIRELMALEGVSVELLIIDKTPPLPSPPVWKKLKNIRYLLWKKFSQKANAKSKMIQGVGLFHELKKVEQIECSIVRKGKFSQYFTDKDVEAIRAKKLDFILRFGFNIIRGEILKTTRYGVWSFHHADELKYRGLPACFWEIYKGDPVTGAIMQGLTDRLDGGVPIQKGYLKTNFSSYWANRDALYAESSHWPAQVVRELREGITYRVDRKPSTTKAPIFRNPTNFQMLVFFLRQGKRKALKWWRIVNFEPHWSVGVVNRSITEIAQHGLPKREEIDWVANRSDDYYLADPFGFYNGEQLHILAEQFHYHNKLGTIAEIIQVEGGFSTPRTVINTGSHLSYPFIVEDGGKRWCIPESSQAGHVKAHPFWDVPTHFGDPVFLKNNFDGGDNTLVEVDGTYWMFATNGRDGANFKLHLFYSDSLHGPWARHPGNPVKIDIRSSRPAGTIFRMNGELYRPAQDSSEVYGGRVRLMRITELTKECYAEEEAAILNPLKNSPGPDGLHTLSAVGDKTLIDGMRQRWVWSNKELRDQRIKMLLRRK